MMGKRKQNLPKKPAPMDPTLIKAFTSGRKAGFDEGKLEGITETLELFHTWTEEMDQQVKGIGIHTKLLVQDYFAQRMKETIEKNRRK